MPLLKRWKSLEKPHELEMGSSSHCSWEGQSQEWCNHSESSAPPQIPLAHLSCRMQSNQVILGGVASCGMSCSKPRSPNNPIKFCNT